MDPQLVYSPSEGGVGGMLAKLLGGDCVKDLLTAIANDVPEEMADILASAHPSAFVAFGSPLHVAATCGAEACMWRLLANGASANAADKDGHTPLHLAAIEGSKATICQLLGARADPSLGTEEFRARLMGGGLKIDMPGGRTALHLAVVEGNVEAGRPRPARRRCLVGLQAGRRRGDAAGGAVARGRPGRGPGDFAEAQTDRRGACSRLRDPQRL
mmetsp:Transcript_94059/g.302664  ORF Transcript_94059/g.302664 Transcript_94059/m.302664 type:complete len:215 (+) Transcript_94059:126-770(+)